MSAWQVARRAGEVLRAAVVVGALALTSCGLDPLDYGEFEVSCARDRCPSDFCCNDDAICVEGDADAFGLCPGAVRQ